MRLRGVTWGGGGSRRVDEERQRARGERGDQASVEREKEEENVGEWAVRQ